MQAIIVVLYILWQVAGGQSFRWGEASSMHMTPAGIVGIVAMDNTSVLGKTHTYVLARLSLAFDRLFNGAGVLLPRR